MRSPRSTAWFVILSKLATISAAPHCNQLAWASEPAVGCALPVSTMSRILRSTQRGPELLLDSSLCIGLLVNGIEGLLCQHRNEARRFKVEIVLRCGGVSAFESA